MREILFKAKRLDNGAWVEGSLITYKDGTAFICCEDYIPDVLNKYEVDPSTVCQYTGLTDKNGKKIFEGDKLYDPHENVIYTVGWSEEQAVFQMEYSWYRKSIESTNYCEIIGSIHDGEGGQDGRNL